MEDDSLLYIMEDDSLSLLEVETLKTLPVRNGFDSLDDDDDIIHSYFVFDVSGNQFSTTNEVHKCMSSLLILCQAHICI